MKYKRITPKNLENLISQNDREKLYYNPLLEYAFRLKELEDKIENGTLIELPCKVGDTVYVTYGIAVERWEVTSIQIYGFNMLLRLGHRGTDDYNSQYISELGEYLFLTKEEAEAKLKELNKE